MMAKKKGDKLEFCCAIQYLNSVTVKNAYLIPKIDEGFQNWGMQIFTTLDLGLAFWHLPLKKQDTDKTGFACDLGLFQWKRMQRDSHILATNSTGNDKSNEEIW